jgi:undecaprenyl-diphosphatase
MLETLKETDTQWFLWINSHHTTALDWTMWTLSQHWSWAVVLLAAFALLTLRHEPRRWWLVLAAVMLCFLLADQGSVLIKDTVCRLRPCHALEEVRMFCTHRGGQYGFVSSHAANAFAIATFLILRYRRHFWVCLLLMLWAVLTCYSRAYLGKHYPGDLVCGAALGALIGWCVYLLTHFVGKKIQKSETK